MEPRPKFDNAIKARAIDNFFDMLVAGGYCDRTERQERIQEISAVLSTSWMGGYEIAKGLDDYHSWNITVELVQELDSWSTFAGEALRAAEQDWVARTKPAALFKAGDRVEFDRWKSVRRGTIDKIYDSGPAQYLVIDDWGVGDGRLIVNFEDVRAEQKAEA